MWGRFGFFALFAAALAGGSAMNAGAAAPSAQCRVVDGEKLPHAIAGDAICREVQEAIAAHAPGARYSVEIKVVSPSRLAATLIVDGRTLPVQNFAVMDRNLGEGAIKNFAQSLAAAVKAASS